MERWCKRRVLGAFTVFQQKGDCDGRRDTGEIVTSAAFEPREGNTEITYLEITPSN